MPSPLPTTTLVTDGLAPKAILAAILPTLGGVLAVLIQWVATGEFDRAELATSITAVAAAALAFAGAWLGAPGAVREQLVTPSDEGLSEDVAERLK